MERAIDAVMETNDFHGEFPCYAQRKRDAVRMIRFELDARDDPPETLQITATSEFFGLIKAEPDQQPDFVLKSGKRMVINQRVVRRSTQFIPQQIDPTDAESAARFADFVARFAGAKRVGRHQIDAYFGADNWRRLNRGSIGCSVVLALFFAVPFAAFGAWAVSGKLLTAILSMLFAWLVFSAAFFLLFRKYR